MSQMFKKSREKVIVFIFFPKQNVTSIFQLQNVGAADLTGVQLFQLPLKMIDFHLFQRYRT